MCPRGGDYPGTSCVSSRRSRRSTGRGCPPQPLRSTAGGPPAPRPGGRPRALQRLGLCLPWVSRTRLTPRTHSRRGPSASLVTAEAAHRGLDTPEDPRPVALIIGRRDDELPADPAPPGCPAGVGLA